MSESKKELVDCYNSLFYKKKISDKFLGEPSLININIANTKNLSISADLRSARFLGKGVHNIDVAVIKSIDCSI